MGFFSKKPKSPAPPAPEAQALLAATPTPTSPPPDITPSSSAKAPSLPPPPPPPPAAEVAPPAPLEEVPATPTKDAPPEDKAERRAKPTKSTSSPASTPNSSQRSGSGLFKTSPKGSKKDKKKDPSPPQQQPQPEPTAGPSLANGADRVSHKEDRRNSRGLGYGMGFKKIEVWAQPSFSGAASDRSYGVRGRPLRADGQTKTVAGDKALHTAGVGTSKHGNFPPVPNLDLANPLPAAPEEDRPNFSGRWKCTSVDGQWDAYLKLLQIDDTRRAIAKGTHYGKGRSIQTIDMPESNDQLTISNVIYRPWGKRPITKGKKKKGAAAAEATEAQTENGAAEANGGAEATGDVNAAADAAKPKRLSPTTRLVIDGSTQEIAVRAGGPISGL